MKYSIQSIFIGKPQTFISKQGKEIHTAFRKNPVEQNIFLGKLNFEGDLQADLEHHGGPDKAVCVYPFDHYSYWEKVYGRSFSLGAFGENITVQHLTENEVSIGDVFSLGEAVVQVVQPRQPCYKIAASHGLRDFPDKIVKTGYSGYYLRVLQEGLVSAHDSLVLKEKGSVTVANVNRLLYHEKKDTHLLQMVLDEPALAEGLRKSLMK
ncbi:MOSC domain-containing protein [Bacillaceae bacterium S4-13-56]